MYKLILNVSAVQLGGGFFLFLYFLWRCQRSYWRNFLLLFWSFLELCFVCFLNRSSKEFLMFVHQKFQWIHDTKLLHSQSFSFRNSWIVMRRHTNIIELRRRRSAAFVCPCIRGSLWWSWADLARRFCPARCALCWSSDVWLGGKDPSAEEVQLRKENSAISDMVFEELV